MTLQPLHVEGSIPVGMMQGDSCPYSHSMFEVFHHPHKDCAEVCLRPEHRRGRPLVCRAPDPPDGSSATDDAASGAGSEPALTVRLPSRNGLLADLGRLLSCITFIQFRSQPTAELVSANTASAWPGCMQSGQALNCLDKASNLRR